MPSKTDKEIAADILIAAINNGLIEKSMPTPKPNTKPATSKDIIDFLAQAYLSLLHTVYEDKNKS